ncbi:kinase-like domain-containing protein [Aspergillus flavus]|uniref:Kinase-like domain-containing protein n=2 Tax=Aspergillus flavus TaxID=5059 RepID=A0A7U2MQP1_ASPFN|nr:kinase-like domain-containing protein [Aspergillus flavus]QRD88172.1 kinase-like domain-containing protein [Aspergillus flavus]
MMPWPTAATEDSSLWKDLGLGSSCGVELRLPLSLSSHEVLIQDKIIQDAQDTSHLVTYLATFLLPRPGDNGHRRVLVLPLMGPCLSWQVLEKTSMATRMFAARQLLEALENLHNAGIVHRDLNEKNCMWGITPLHDLSRSAKYEVHGRPLKEVIPVVDLWKQGELVGPLKIPENLRTEKSYLGDFGLAVKVNTPVTHKGYPPMKFCSPDRLHGKHPSFACDMWSYMVIFGVLYLNGYSPFSTVAHGGVISDIVRSLGPLPEQWKGLYVYPGGGLDSWYDQSKTPEPNRNLASTIAYFRADADPVERELVHSIMLKIFTYCPEKRLTATQLLQDPSFRALMEKYGC